MDFHGLTWLGASSARRRHMSLAAASPLTACSWAAPGNLEQASGLIFICAVIFRSVALEKLAQGFWNLRGELRLAHVVDIGTQMSLVEAAEGGFLLLDCYEPDEAELEELLALTDGGARIGTVLNLHPFHTLHCEFIRDLLPNARFIGTRRHHEELPGLSAHDLEKIVTDHVVHHLSDPAASVCTSDQHAGDADGRVEKVAAARDLLRIGGASEQRETLLEHVSEVQLFEGHISVTLNQKGSLAADHLQPTKVTISAVRIRRGHDIRLVIPAPGPVAPKRDARLVQLVADAVVTRDRLQWMGEVPIAKAAARLGCCRSTLTQRIKLSYLAPDIIEAILAGTQPRSLTRRRLASIDLPIDWREQRKMLGFG